MHRYVGATVLAVMLAVGAHAGAAQSAPPTGADLKTWHEKIAKVPHPSANECFTAKYPRLVWQATACTIAPSIPMPPKPGPRPLVVGNGNDVAAQAPSGFISETTGTFENVTNVTSESSPIGNVGPPVADAYTLQINTEFFVSTACAASPNPGCRGWEQFVFANDGTSGFVFIQYWLIQFNAACAAGWNQFQFTGDPDIYCYRNSAAAPVPNQPITNLHNLELTGTASAGADGVALFDGVMGYSTPGTNSVDAANGWTIAEFNVFGYGGNSDGGSMASFNPGASLDVRTRIIYGGGDPPICLAQGFTAETNNLNFALPAPAMTQPGPAVIVHLDETGPAVANCSAATVVGDTHQHTFAGLLYDFQASGDFVEAQAGADFEVQTRKASGAPNWPNASVNKSVATRMGSTKVALCDGQRLVVDGRTAEVGPGKSIHLPSGVSIHHIGNAYFVVDAAGNSIKVTVNSGYINVEVGLGTWPTKVRGLLGNPDNNVQRLEAKDGTQFSIPISFQDLYSRFGDSWRVSPLRTLLAPCGQVAAGNPAAPFYARDLDQDRRKRGEAICLRAKVIKEWLETCILDVAVVGDKAAEAFVGLAPPVLNGNP